MTDNSKKVSELPLAANMVSTDRLLILKDPTGSPSVRTINLATFSANLVIQTAPVTSSSNGVAGTIARDNNFIYVCVSNNSWKRAALTTW